MRRAVPPPARLPTTAVLARRARCRHAAAGAPPQPKKQGGTSTVQIGFVGTGTMGTPIAGCLIRAGHALSVYDRRPEATDALCAAGATRADSGFAAAHDAEVLFTSLPGPAEFEAAMLEAQTGILA